MDFESLASRSSQTRSSWIMKARGRPITRKYYRPGSKLRRNWNSLSSFLWLAFYCLSIPVNQPRSGLASPLWGPRSCCLLQPLLESCASALGGGRKEGHLPCFSRRTLLVLSPLLDSLSSQSDFHSYSSSRTRPRALAHSQGFGLGPSNSAQ